jgi:rubrerythrin
MFYFNYPDQDRYQEAQWIDDEEQWDMGVWMSDRGDDTLLEEDLLKALTGEAQAYYFYDRLAEMAPTEEEQAIIYGIQEDEAKHFNWFSMMLERIGGEIPQIPVGELPKDYKEGVKKAFHDELEANEFYLDTAFQATVPYVERNFLYASQDEQRHATQLQHILMNMK